MDAAAATAWLTAGLAENGPLQDMFREAVSRALTADLASDTGVIRQALDPVRETADSTSAELTVFRTQMDTQFQALQKRVEELEKIALAQTSWPVESGRQEHLEHILHGFI